MMMSGTSEPGVTAHVTEPIVIEKHVTSPVTGSVVAASRGAESVPGERLTVLMMPCRFGALRLVGAPLGAKDELRGVYWPDQPWPGGPGWIARRTPLLARAAAQLTEYFAGTRREFDLPLGPRGTAFQVTVWGALTRIPFGATCSYGDLARSIGRPTASRAVGAANGQNPISIIVPCHRVIGSNGELTGYAGGLATKRWLIEHEQR